jgi:hypothetical protein
MCADKPRAKLLSLTDQERRAIEPGYRTHHVYLSYEEFPQDSQKQKDEIKRLRKEQNLKNLAWRSRSAYAAVLVNGVRDPEMLAMKAGVEKALDRPLVPSAQQPQPQPQPQVMAPQFTPEAYKLGQTTPLPKYTAGCNLTLDPGTGNTVLLVASSKAGKTTLQMYLYKKYFRKTIAVMFAHSTQLKIYRDKGLIVTDHFEPDIVELMRRLNKISKNKFEFTCLFDDQLNVRNDTIQDLFLSLRNSNISSLISLQYVNLLSKSCRGNVNTILGGAMNSDENILVFVKCYLLSWMHKQGLRSEPAMIDYYRRLTADHGFVNIRPAHDEVTFCRLKLVDGELPDIKPIKATKAELVKK